MTRSQPSVAAILDISLRALGRARRPRLHGRLHLEGLRASVEVIRDRWGVPHLYAGKVHDLLFAQGFVHAQDRLWQMDFQRRVVAGRLSELLGPAALPSDRGMRILGARDVAEAEVALLSLEARSDLEAYAAGVNAYIARQPLPVEFTLLHYRPEPWTPADSLSWAKMMSWGLSVNWETELLRAALIERLGPALAAELEPPPPAHSPTVMPPFEGPIARLQGSSSQATPSRQHERYTNGDSERVNDPRRVTENSPISSSDERTPGSPIADGDSSLPLVARDDGCGEGAQDGRAEAFPPSGAALGSNNWVVAGWRSVTGMPLLANDMHLPIRSPAIWYENHLICDELNVTGIGLPGIPYVVAGHNGHVAWGFTNGFPDVQDLFVERLRRREDGRVQYQFRGAWLDAEVRREVIRIKGAEPIIEEVIVTHHGPIINALAPGLVAPCMPPRSSPDAGTQDPPATDSPLENPVALRWTSLEPDRGFHALRAMSRARTCVEFRAALAEWAAPVQNTVYADIEGNIAYSYPGRVPIRAQGDGRVPAPGWTGTHEWLGYVPFDELPHQLNPPSGYIASANNRVADETFPHFLGREFPLGDRAERITVLIQSRPKLDVDFFRHMQFDLISPTMHTIAGYLGTLAVADPELAPVVALVRRWDRRLTAESPAAAVCEIFGRLVMKQILENRLGDLAERALGKGPSPLLQEASFFSERTWEWLLHILTLPHSHWFDLGHGERRDDVLRLALRRTVNYLRDRLGPAQPPAFEAWAWGRLHTITFAHLAGSAPALSRHFSRGPFPLGGDDNTLWATGAGLTDAAGAAVVGPPFRFIADLGDLNRCWGLLAPGNSGRPASPHYDDQIKAWFTGTYHPMLYAREDVECGVASRLSLHPPPHPG